jgi:hypothetical protein
MLSNIMTTAIQLWAINHISSSNGLLYSNLNLEQDSHTTPDQGRRYRSLSMEQIQYHQTSHSILAQNLM